MHNRVSFICCSNRHTVLIIINCQWHQWRKATNYLDSNTLPLTGIEPAYKSGVTYLQPARQLKKTISDGLLMDHNTCYVMVFLCYGTNKCYILVWFLDFTAL